MTALPARSEAPLDLNAYNPPMPLKTVPVSHLHESPDNPRRAFGDMTELTDSVRRIGILEPIIARKRDEGGYWIVAGARRSRAAKAAGLKEVEVVLRDFDRTEALAATIAENKDRESFTALELAQGYKTMKELGLSEDQVAKRVGVARSSVYAYLALLTLPQQVQTAIQQGKLPADAGRAIAGFDGERLQLAFFAEAMKLTKPGEKGPSVRAVLNLLKQKKTKAKRGATKAQLDAKAHGAQVALRRRVLERLRVRVAELVERRAQLSDEDLRLLALADAETGPDVLREVYQRRGLRPDRLAKVVGAQLRSLTLEMAVAKFATLEDGEFGAGAKAVARVYGLSLAEMQKAIEQESAAEALFAKET